MVPLSSLPVLQHGFLCRGSAAEAAGNWSHGLPLQVSNPSLLLEPAVPAGTGSTSDSPCSQEYEGVAAQTRHVSDPITACHYLSS